MITEDNVEDVVEENNFLFENGHWIWNEERSELEFIQHVVEEPKIIMERRTPWGYLKFNEACGISKQREFARIYKRKFEDPEDVILLQDIKDVVIFTAPLALLNEEIIKLMHTACYDRFIRALIVYMCYFMQLRIRMRQREIEGQNKLRSEVSQVIEFNWANNLSEMRVVVAKEYFHLTFVDKKLVGLTTNNVVLKSEYMEMFLRLATQIVWVCFRRKNYDTIDIEIGRLFRTETYNLSLHRCHLSSLHLDTYTEYVLYGNFYEIEYQKRLNGGAKPGKKKNTSKLLTPLGEALLNFRGDERILGLNLIGFARSETKLAYLENWLSAPEEKFPEFGIVLGLLGRPRKLYDDFFKRVKAGKSMDGSSTISSTPSHGTSRASFQVSEGYSLYELMKVPPSEPGEIGDIIPPKYKQRSTDIAQRDKWIKRIKSLKK